MIPQLKPKTIEHIATFATPLLVALNFILWPIALYTALIYSPPDYQQGEAVRMLYVHVPAAWMSLMIYACMALASLAYLASKAPIWHLLVQAAAPVGLTMTLITLLTGMLWGKPIWGVYWVWDARLTSMLILAFIYMGYLALIHAMEDETLRAKLGSAFVLLGALNLPIIKFSVDWWSTLHQPASILRADGPALDASMLTPLLLMMAAYASTLALSTLLRVRTMLALRKATRKALAS